MARLLLGLVAVVATSASVAHAATPNGIWQGRFVYPMEIGNIPTSAYPTSILTIATASVRARFHGRTQAAHDALTAPSTCSMTFRFLEDADGWRLYSQVGRKIVAEYVSDYRPDDGFGEGRLRGFLHR